MSLTRTKKYIYKNLRKEVQLAYLRKRVHRGIKDTLNTMYKNNFFEAPVGTFSQVSLL